jgi:hypothetical protein
MGLRKGACAPVTFIVAASTGTASGKSALTAGPLVQGAGLGKLARIHGDRYWTGLRATVRHDIVGLGARSRPRSARTEGD